MKQVATLAEFQAALAEAGDKLVVVDFYATWCGPCKMIAPMLQKKADETPEVVFLKVDVDENDETAAKYGISAMPTFKFFKGGEQVEEVVGANWPKIEGVINSRK